MSQVISFEDYTPVARYDSVAWTKVRVEESDSTVLADVVTWTQIDEITLSPVEPDPANPLARNFTTELATDTPLLWYRVIFVDATGDTEVPTDPIQNSGTPSTYSTVSELARILKKNRNPSAEESAAMARVLLAAAEEIDSEIDLADGVVLSTRQLAIAAEVNLDRAAELWFEEEVRLGWAGIGSDMGATPIARNTWERYANKLAPLKGQWGVA